MEPEDITAKDYVVERCENCIEGLYRFTLTLSDGRVLQAYANTPDAEVTFIDNNWVCDDCSE